MKLSKNIPKSKMKIAIEQFQGLNNRDKLTILYENQQETMDLIRGYKLYYRVSLVVNALLLGAVTYFFKLVTM